MTGSMQGINTFTSVKIHHLKGIGFHFVSFGLGEGSTISGIEIYELRDSLYANHGIDITAAKSCVFSDINIHDISDTLPTTGPYLRGVYFNAGDATNLYGNVLRQVSIRNISASNGPMGFLFTAPGCHDNHVDGITLQGINGWGLGFAAQATNNFAIEISFSGVTGYTVRFDNAKGNFVELPTNATVEDNTGGANAMLFYNKQSDDPGSYWVGQIFFRIPKNQFPGTPKAWVGQLTGGHEYAHKILSSALEVYDGGDNTCGC